MLFSKRSLISVSILAVLLAFPLRMVAIAQELVSSVPSSSQIEFFESKIRPVLIEHCYECHSSQSKPIQGGLALDSAQGLLRGGDSGAALVARQSDASLIIQALRYETNQMPPRGKLSDSVIADFVEWVNIGAPDPRTEPHVSTKKEIDFDRAREFWSFVPPRLTEIPQPEGSEWAEANIDLFILAEMEKYQLSPVPRAEKLALLRRATFDLTGLPPTPDEIESFLADTATDAFARVVDRLLQSQAYGERWGRYWLDIARYSEDQAHTFSVQPNTNGYRYRDWVISAFNSDMPFDRFIQYQIAADMMEIAEEDKLSNLPALGYFGLGAQYYKNSDAAKAAADELDDRIDTLTRGFLGLTVSCARCHDHKYDPIPQQDYYSLAGVFHSSRLHNAPLVPAPEVERYNQARQKIKKREESIQQTIVREGPKLREARLGEVAKYLMATRTFRLERAKNDSLKLRQFAQSQNLDEGTLKRWIEFLKSKPATQSPALRLWFELIDSTQANEPPNTDAASLVANTFQSHLNLLIRQREGRLSVEEQASLAEVQGVGNARFSSPNVTKTQPTTFIDVDLTGAKELVLVVHDGGNGPSCDHADWLDPKLITSSGEIPLTDLKWRSAQSTYGNVNINKNVGGQPLRVAGKTYGNGIGTHSTSTITYDLPEDVLRFQAVGGLDNSGSDQGGDCGENAAVQFRVYIETPTDIQTPQTDLLAEIFGEKGVFSMTPAEIEKQLPEDVRTNLAEQRKELEQLRRESPNKLPIAHVITDSNPSDLKVMVRGNPANQGEVAPRRFLKILSPDKPSPFTRGSGRLELAQAIASPHNPLTARVIVNRVWQHHFGRGLVGTPDNFGKLGETPTHPGLLDYLTVQFINEGWSLKNLHRAIMLSSTYKLSSESNESNMQRDADNRYLWRMNRRRLDVEAWRDALLSVSGRIDRKMEGPSLKLTDSANNRRTIYAFISRHELDNMLRLFDFPDANITSSTRAETTVPQQQLFVLNSPFMIEQTKAFAARVLKETGAETEDRIRFAYRLAFGRDARTAEVKIGLRYLQAEDMGEDRDRNKMNRWERYAQALLGSNEFMYLD